MPLDPDDVFDAATRGDAEALERFAREHSAQVEAQARMLREAETPLVLALRQVQIDVNSVWDMANGKDLPDQAIPILIDFLSRPDTPDRIKAGILRSMAVRRLHPYLSLFTAHFINGEGPAEREAAAVAVAAVVKKTDFDSLIDMLGDPELSRAPGAAFLVKALVRIDRSRAAGELRRFVDHPAVGPEATRLLKRMG